MAVLCHYSLFQLLRICSRYFSTQTGTTHSVSSQKYKVATAWRPLKILQRSLQIHAKLHQSHYSLVLLYVIARGPLRTTVARRPLNQQQKDDQALQSEALFFQISYLCTFAGLGDMGFEERSVHPQVQMCPDAFGATHSLPVGQSISTW